MSVNMKLQTERALSFQWNPSSMTLTESVMVFWTVAWSDAMPVTRGSTLKLDEAEEQ